MKRYMKIAVCAFLILLSASANVYAIHWFLWTAPVSVRIGQIGPRSADLSVSCKPSRIIVGASATIEGQLINASSGEGLGRQPIGLFYKESGDSLWNYITSVYTSLDGAYSHLWIEASTLISGHYVVNATFAGSIAFDRWTSITDLQVIPQTPVQEIPIAILSASPTNIEAWGDVAFDASASYDPDGSIVSYWFDFGDGFDSGWTPSPAYDWFYTEAGVYYATLKVKDNDGLVSEWSEPIEIKIRLELIKEFFPHWKFSGPIPIWGEEKFYPCGFYFDDGDVTDNCEEYEDYYEENGEYPPYFVYIHEVQDATYLTLQYWLYYVYNSHIWYPHHDHDWDSTIFIVFEKDELAQPFENIQPLKVGFAHHGDIDYYAWESLSVSKWQDTHIDGYVAWQSHGVYPNDWERFIHNDAWAPNGIEASFAAFSWVIVAGNPTYTSEGPEYEWSLIDHTTITLHGYGTGIEHPGNDYNEGYWPNRFKGGIPELGATADPAPWHRISGDPLWKDPFGQNKPSIWNSTIPTLPSSLMVGVVCPVDIHLYDPLGRHVGMDYETGELDLEIPNAVYQTEADFKAVLVYEPTLGEYSMELMGTGDGSYVIFATFSYGEAAGFQSQTGEIVKDAVYSYNVVITEEVMIVEPHPIAELEHLREFISNLPDDVFVSDDPDEFVEFKKEMFDKIDETFEELSENKYAEAIGKLDNMKEEVTDEDKLGPTTQSDLCVIIDHIISSIETLQPQPD